MNRTRRIRFLVKLYGLAQQLAPPAIKAVGYEQSDWEKAKISGALASWELWLQAGRLADYEDEDFPDVPSTEKEKVPKLIDEFEGYASRYSKLSQKEKSLARDVLISLIHIFKRQLANTHGEPGDRGYE
ncbi:MAG TPA: hypothetical protein PLU30_16165 [Verrucomicrobiae bacterium]|nr:hypothetical protein [Verrucomicrobiae bacterium]